MIVGGYTWFLVPELVWLQQRLVHLALRSQWTICMAWLLYFSRHWKLKQNISWHYHWLHLQSTLDHWELVRVECWFLSTLQTVCLQLRSSGLTALVHFLVLNTCCLNLLVKSQWKYQQQLLDTMALPDGGRKQWHGYVVFIIFASQRLIDAIYCFKQV